MSNYEILNAHWSNRHGYIHSSLLVAFFLALPFSHAPSFIGPYFTIPFFVISAILANFLFNSFILRRGCIDFKEIFYICIILLSVSYFIWHAIVFRMGPKVNSYLIAYSWLPVSMFVICYYARRTDLGYSKIRNALLFGVFICLLYNFFEIISAFKGGGDSIIPRYDREEYRFHSPFGFRVRGFNYESANYALYINSVMYFLVRGSSGFKFKLFMYVIWVLTLVMAFSSFHIVFFVFVMAPAIIFSSLKKVSFVYVAIASFLSLILIPFLIYAFYDDIILALGIVSGKALSYFLGVGLESGEMRNSLIHSALLLIIESPIFGSGLSSFYNYQDTGYNNFFLQVFQQLGILGLLFYIVLMSFPFFFLSKINLDSLVYFLLLLFSLWFTADFWLPQILFLQFLIVYRKGKV